MSSYWDVYKLDILMKWPMALAMAMMISERKPPPMPPGQDGAHTVIGDFTKITVSNSDNDLHLVQVTSARLDGRMPVILEVEIWGTVTLWMFLLSRLFSSLYFFTSLDHSPAQMVSAWVFTTSGDKSSRGAVSDCPRSTEWLPYSTDPLWDIWVYTFAYVELLFDCFLFFHTMVRVYPAQEVCT